MEKTGQEEGHVRAVDRALVLLAAFREEDGPLPLGELARRSGLHLTTALRLLGTLESHGFVQRLPPGGYVLGATLLLLGERFRRTLRLDDHVRPALERLRVESQESAAFFVREEAQRRCLFRLDSPQRVRDHARVGEAQPLGIGAHGRALLALDPPPAERPRLPIISRGERLADVAAIAAPVLGAGGLLAGSIGITMPLYRFGPESERLCTALVMREALSVTAALGGDPTPIAALA
ncbi:IclR family transcriptional regulator [Falsiroseomonas selenitidurans]|uniref:IclR family transcriptional regulator n=1 Tax=Falsiroseomonas selenitidurans TaxID=2716335 RepID=A0ABX1EAZ9_9PROT|nr:IclR family transcriptional regulator [Falsiroseomonas selenitidurans]NKC34397.1 IclR family transcriptional regulator [Falsiroseomonas selenitidurans]